jgi:RNAse (barnase) inhibitor barstar
MTRQRFAEVLGDARRAGVYHLPHEGIGDLRAAAEDRQLAMFRLNLQGVATKDDFLDAIASSLHFPDWFGRNWDALEDCLGDMSWHAAPGYVVILAHADEFRANEQDSFLLALRIFQSAAESWREDGVPFWTLVELRPNGVAFLADLP